MLIKHLVIPAGGLHFFILYGILKHLNIEGIWKLEYIKNLCMEPVVAHF